MAKLYRFTGYLLDIDDEFGNFKSYLEYINQRKSGSDIKAEDVQVAEFEWDDDIDLNKYNCSCEQMDVYFRSNREREQ